MGYVKPTVLISQEIRTPSPVLNIPDQKACIVGPAYNIVEDKYAGDFVSGTPLDLPEWIPGTRVEEIKVTIKNALSPVLSITNVTVSGEYYEDTTADFTTTGIKEGMVVEIGSVRTSVLKVEPTRIYFTDTVPSTTGDLVVYDIVNYEVPSAEISVDNETGKLTVTTTNVKEGQVFVTYKAIRADIANHVFEFDNTDQVEAAFGLIRKDNPLAYAVAKALANSSVKIYACPISSNDSNGYGDALQRLAAEDVYFIVPLSDDPAIKGLMESHVESLSVPEIKKWRIAICAAKYMDEYVIFEGTGDVQNGILYDPDARFLGEVDPQLSTYAVINGEYYKVHSVISNQKLELQASLAGNPPDATGVNYKIVIKLETKYDIKKYLIDSIKNISSKRYVEILPPYMEDEDGSYIPGYFAAAALAGLLSSIPVQQPITFMQIGGFGAAPMTNGTLFDESDLDELAGAGYLILTQDTITGPIYIRHQITTDELSDFTREISAVRTVDYLSKVYEETLRPFIGKTNLIDETIEAIKGSLKATSEVLKGMKLPMLGAPLVDYQIEEVKKLTETHLEIVMKVKIPMPLNWITLRLVV